MFPVNIVARPGRLLFSKSRSKKSSSLENAAIEMTNGNNSNSNLRSGYEGKPDVEDAILRKNNEVLVPQFSTSVITAEISNNENDVLLLDKDKEFPDGGMQAWLAVLGSFVGLIPVFGLMNSIGAIESYISKNQLANVAPSTISWIFSLYLSISFFSCILAGGYFDRNGSRMPLCIGTIAYVGGVMALANCSTVWQFILSFSVLTGTGSGILMTPLVSIVATWFFKKRATATSIATMGGSVGGIIFPVMLRNLYVEVGFQWAIRILGFICLSCLLVSILLAREKEIPVAQPFNSKRELLAWYLSSSFNWRYYLERNFFLVALGVALEESSLTTSATYLGSYALMRGNNETIAYALITVTNAVGILGRYIPGYVADRYMGRFNIVILTVSIAALSDFIIWLPFGGHIGALWAYVCVYGFSTGSILSLTPVCIGQISKTEDFGKRYSTAYCLQALLTLAVLPIGGSIIGGGSVSEYNKFIAYVSTLMAAGAICFLMVRYYCVGIGMRKF
ncbi:hypothetical protein HG535_0F02230 [Zygotorulaspora mrakii]|uniref:Major facilitator superfamily (MFS) profile domain-containing protein n=1 Tax=Zygotorulaspora mrakii TaxID=42260 RepID=A0A7H9B7K8_ZYGMR|nr:uncharacterized protein HG535_0F02230 [Zygotorulaspora mrakii]QLG73712.1 hypothetical protein HG535_0F02230 [Zygotorulaspora mrakii]